jgi:hypothetical protein
MQCREGRPSPFHRYGPSDGKYAVVAGTLSAAIRRRAWVGRLPRYVGGTTRPGLGILAAKTGSEP